MKMKLTRKIPIITEYMTVLNLLGGSFMSISLVNSRYNIEAQRIRKRKMPGSQWLIFYFKKSQCI